MAHDLSRRAVLAAGGALALTAAAGARPAAATQPWQSRLVH
ncbi:hypothetical protein [Nonomuraea sp. 10N515B]